jgi:hypothetical protein
VVDGATVVDVVVDVEVVVGPPTPNVQGVPLNVQLVGVAGVPLAPKAKLVD